LLPPRSGVLQVCEILVPLFKVRPPRFRRIALASRVDVPIPLSVRPQRSKASLPALLAVFLYFFSDFVTIFKVYRFLPSPSVGHLP